MAKPKPNLPFGMEVKLPKNFNKYLLTLGILWIVFGGVIGIPSGFVNLGALVFGFLLYFFNVEAKEHIPIMIAMVCVTLVGLGVLTEFFRYVPGLIRPFVLAAFEGLIFLMGVPALLIGLKVLWDAGGT